MMNLHSIVAIVELFFILNRLAFVTLFLVLGTKTGGHIPELTKFRVILTGVKFVKMFFGIVDHIHFQVVPLA
jgi:sRNA-binding regulator protein Hfq